MRPYFHLPVHTKAAVQVPTYFLPPNWIWNKNIQIAGHRPQVAETQMLPPFPNPTS